MHPRERLHVGDLREAFCTLPQTLNDGRDAISYIFPTLGGERKKTFKDTHEVAPSTRPCLKVTPQTLELQESTSRPPTELQLHSKSTLGSLSSLPDSPEAKGGGPVLPLHVEGTPRCAEASTQAKRISPCTRDRLQLLAPE